MPKGLVVFAYVFGFCFLLAVAWVTFWYSILIRTAGVYSITESSSCDVLFLNADGTYGQRVDLYHSGQITNTVRSKGTWHKIGARHLELSGEDFLNDQDISRFKAPIPAEDSLHSGIFHTLSVHTLPHDLNYDRPITGSTACWLVGMS